jgi:hypothetical protein
MGTQEMLESLAAKYKSEGFEVLIRPSAEDLPSFLATEEVLLFGRRGTEIIAIHPGSETKADFSDVWREPSDFYLGTMLLDAKRLLNAGSSEAALLVAWLVAEAGLRRQAAKFNIDVRRSRHDIEALIHLGQNNVLTTEEVDELLVCRRLKTTIAHGFEPNYVRPRVVRSLIEVGHKLLEIKDDRRRTAFCFNKTHLGRRLVSNPAAFNLVKEAGSILERCLDSSAKNVNASWDYDDAIFTLRLEDALGAVTGTFSRKEMENSDTLIIRLNRLWGDLLEVRNHSQLDELKETSVKEEE